MQQVRFGIVGVGNMAPPTFRIFSEATCRN